ncbi:radical SAM protein [Candidatus Binatia bacterium]|nr:radical SAM protein [Candidatus Binatia bacterium]
MKVMIGYPPLESEKGQGTLGQNRQFSWFSHPSYIYPMVPAQAATCLAQQGHEVLWTDAIAEEWEYGRFLSYFLRQGPDLVAFETKTPVVTRHWRIIRQLKSLAPSTKFVLMGDHVTALPAESLLACPVDFVVAGGDYDFALLSICDHLTTRTPLEAGIWFRDGATIRSGAAHGAEKRDYDALPLIDRELTRWDLYGEHLFYKPCTYTMVGRDCWRPRCTFCSWTTLWPRFRTRSAESLLDEIGHILDRYRVKEIFDDTGTFPVGAFLRTFCRGMIDRGFARRVHFSCNMRINALRLGDYRLMAKAGFRLLKFGIESASQKTLDMLGKGTSVEDLVRGCKEAKAAGLSPHLTTMVGYPWETRAEAQGTLDLVRRLFEDGYADTIQATVVIPYPGTPLFRQAEANGWLKYGRDWDTYDMTCPVMHAPFDDTEVMDMVKRLYGSFLSPRFIARKLLSIRSAADVMYYGRAAKVAVAHMMDFRRSERDLDAPRGPAPPATADDR